MQDEGVGIHALRVLQETYKFEPEIDIIDGGTSGLDLLPFFRPESQMIMIDAMVFDEPPGSIGRVEDEDILARLNTKTSVHHLGLSDLLAMARLTEMVPKKIVLFGVKPESMELEVGLTDTVNESIPRLITHVIEQVEQWGIKAFKKEGIE